MEERSRSFARSNKIRKTFPSKKSNVYDHPSFSNQSLEESSSILKEPISILKEPISISSALEEPLPEKQLSSSSLSSKESLSTSLVKPQVSSEITIYQKIHQIRPVQHLPLYLLILLSHYVKAPEIIKEYAPVLIILMKFS